MPTLGSAGCRDRFHAADHAVLGTVHERRGVDLVPVVFALAADTVLVPVDRVKAKSTTRLTRLTNIAADPRATLLVEHYDDDWSALWWARASGTATLGVPGADELRALAARHPQYEDPASIASIIRLSVHEWTGWSA